MAQVEENNLLRFVAAQDSVFEQVCAELDDGFKVTHWMWFVFPQLLGLGTSAMVVRFGIADLNEAKGYLAHPVLGDRLRLCVQKVLGLQGKSATQIFGNVDAMKFKSSLTLFAIAAQGSADSELFEKALKKYFAGFRDQKTVSLLG